MQLLHSLNRLASTATGVLETRLELLAAEIQLEKLRLMRMVWVSVLGASALVIGLVASFGLALELTPDEYDYLLYLGFALAFLSTAIICLVIIKRFMKRESEAFAMTRLELEKDKECLKSLRKS